MHKILKFVCLALLSLSISCKREYAYFQKTSSESFSGHEKLVDKQAISIEKPLLIENKAEDFNLITVPEEELATVGIENSIVLGSTVAKQKTDIFPKKPFRNRKRISTAIKIKRFFNKAENKVFAKKQTKKRRDGFWGQFNERLKIGLVLLGVAIIFALLHVNVLAIIFGILAAFMIIRGLKRLF